MKITAQERDDILARRKRSGQRTASVDDLFTKIADGAFGAGVVDKRVIVDDGSGDSFSGTVKSYNPDDDTIMVKPDSQDEVAGPYNKWEWIPESQKSSQKKRSAINWTQDGDYDFIGFAGGAEAHIVASDDLSSYGVVIFHDSGRVEEIGSGFTLEQAKAEGEAALTDSFLWQP